MRIDEGKAAIAASVVAAAGILLLFFLAETPRKASVAEALVAPQNSLLEISGKATAIAPDKFQLCDQVCISVRSNELASARLLYETCPAVVTGRVDVYLGNRYFEAEKIEIE